MPDIHILRSHSLGLPEARKVAVVWAQKAEKKFGMECTYEEGEVQDSLHFSRAGVKGSLQVCADQVALHAGLGFLFGAFQERIESESSAQLDKLLMASEATTPAGSCSVASTEAPAPDPAGSKTAPHNRRAS